MEYNLSTSNLSPENNIRYSRRDWFAASGVALGALVATAISGCYNRKSRPTIVLCSGWQTVNIGDIAHSPGLIQLMKKYLPPHDILFWPSMKLDRGVYSMLLGHFPELKIVEGSWEEPEVRRKVAQADLLIHGSGPAVMLIDRITEWHRFTGKPFGVFGVTVSSIDDRLRDFLQKSKFVFTRESHSLQNIHDAGITNPVTGFAPDATFAMSLKDENKAAEFMSAHDLLPEKFICAVPRLRKTPYYKIYPDHDYSPEQIKSIELLNATHAESDHVKLRETMINWVRKTGRKVAVVPEMTYQLDIMDQLLIDPLPEDVKNNVVRRHTYWLPDEAATLYAQSRAVLSFECHSPILAVAQGTPALYLRQPEDTIKGQMWYDLGFDDWVFEIEDTTSGEITETLMAIHSNPDLASRYLQSAMGTVSKRYTEAMKVVGKAF